MRRLLLVMFLPALLRPQAKTVAGQFRAALGFEWKISGDDNRTARVETTYRKKGEREWRRTPPLMARSTNP